MHIVIVVQGQADLLQIIGASRTPRTFAGRLHGRQEQRNENADDGDHHKQLHERKTTSDDAWHS